MSITGVTLKSHFLGQITWEQLDINSRSKYSDKGSAGTQVNFIDTGNGDFAINEVWYDKFSIQPADSGVVDFTGTVLEVPGGNISVPFSNIKSFNITNTSGNIIRVGNSGLTNSIDIFGVATEVGISGVLSWESAVGTNINSTNKELAFHNLSATETGEITISVLGIRSP